MTISICYHSLLGLSFLPVWVKYKNLISLYDPLLFPVYSIIILNVTSTYIENHIRQYYNFCFKCQAYLENSREGKPVLFIHIFANWILPEVPSFILSG